MSKTYNHLSLEERAVMQVMLDHGCSLRAAVALWATRWLYPALVALAEPAATAAPRPNSVPSDWPAKPAWRARCSRAMACGLG